MTLKDISIYIKDRDECRIYVINSINKDKIIKYFYADDTEEMQKYQDAILSSIDFLERAIIICVD